MIIVRNCGVFGGKVTLCCARTRLHRFTRPAAEGMERDAERRTTSGGLCSLAPFRRSPNAPRDRYPPASRQVALFRPYRDPELAVSSKRRRSKRAGHSRPGHTLSPPTTPTAGGSGQQPDPRTVRVSPSDLIPLDRPPPPQRSLATRPFLATRWGNCKAGFQAGDGRARMLVEHPSPLAGEGGRRRRSDEGSPRAQPLAPKR